MPSFKRHTMRFAHAVILALVAATALPALADYSATANPAIVVVTNFDGWGTSIAWWGNVVGGYSNRNTYADLAFTQLKLNIVRYNIGGGENPNINNTMAFRAQMPGFEPTNGTWNWNADANQRWMLQAALARGVDHVEAFANSPPWWMTVSGSVTGSTNGTSNNLQTNYETAFAIYLATVVSNLSVLEGVHFDTVTPVNEPTSPWWVYGGSQEGCHISSDQQARLVNDLRAQLNAQGQTNTGVAASEDNDENSTVNSLTAYGGTALGNTARFVTHSYGANNPSGLRSLANAENKPLWVSEYGVGDSTGMTMARRIHDDITMMAPRGWVYWQIVDSGGGWGPLYNPEVATTNPSFTTNFTVNESFYVLGQFSQFIRPGCRIITVNDANSLAAYNPTNSTLVIVTLNDSSSPFNVTYNLSSFSNLPAQVSLYRTSATQSQASLAPLPVTNQQFSSFLPAQSVTTHILTNVIQGLVGLTQDIAPLAVNLYAGMTNSFSVQASGTPPFAYAWLLDGTPTAGATNSSYTFAVPLGTNMYQCVITNSQGSVRSSLATVIGAPPPLDAYSVALLEDGPLAYWRLNEPAGSTVAYDYVGGYNGTYGENTTNGLPGAPTSLFPGFQNELAAAMDNSVGTVGAGYVTTAGVNLNTNTVTLLCWAFPFTNEAFTGLVFCRSGSTVAGTQIGNNELGYTWANNPATWEFVSGLIVPTNMWSLLALTTTASNAILYVFNARSQGSATNNVANPVQSFSGGFALGADQQSSTLPERIFNGKMDEVAVFDYPMSATQLGRIYQAASGGLTVSAQYSKGRLTLTWPFGALQQAGATTGPWSTVSGATSPYTNSTSASQVFYRVVAESP